MAIVPTVGSVPRPLAHGYDGQIDNVLIRLAASPETPMEDMTAEASPQRVDTSEGAEDIREEVGHRYSRTTLEGGAGLDFLHSSRRPDDAPIRYWDSAGVDVFSASPGESYRARLVHRMDAESAGSTVVDVCQIDDTVYHLRTNGIYEDGVGLQLALTSPVKMVAMGNSLYVLDSTGVGRIDPPTWSRIAVHATVFDSIYVGKSRIIGVLNNVVTDTDFDATILTLPAADTVTDLVDAGPALLIFGTTGVIYSMTLDQSNLLVTAGETRFGSEVPVRAAESFGVVGLVTAETNEAGGIVARFYTGNLTLQGGYELSNLQLVYQVGDRDSTDDHTPMAMLSTRDSIYTAIREAGGNDITLWRYYLPTSGYARAHSIVAGGAFSASSMVEVDDRMWVCVPSDDLYKEADAYVTEGYVIGPLADFVTSDSKQWVAGDLTGAALPLGCGLELYDTNDPALINNPASGSWQLVTQLDVGATKGEVNDLSGRNARYHAAKVILRSDSSRLFTPELLSYSFRALPAPNRDILLRIPINVSDQIESPGRRAVTIPGRGKAIQAALRAYEGRQVVVELYRPELEVRGLIERFESVIDIIPQRGSVRKVMWCRIRGTRITESIGFGGSSSGGSLGQDILGTIRFGMGEVR